ncbi:MAG: hypothetical protein MUE73_15395 [Planctomycetes bacterium]|jgi:hypothetical protein|nr:hypothetical protein [Planctomycetota bacterium]
MNGITGPVGDMFLAFNYRADVPPGLQKPLLILGIALAALLLLNFLFSILRAAHRKAYNLTKAETAKAGKGEGPAFLEVDHAARAEAIRRGDEYERPADAAAAPAGKGEPFAFGRLACRFGAITVGAGHVLLLLATVFKTSKDADAVWSRITTWDRVTAVIGRYWFGFVLVGVVIAVEVARYLHRKKKAA